jgi:hypothetical protein
MVQGRDATDFDSSEGLFESRGVGDQFVEDVADGENRGVFSQCFVTSCDDLFDGKRHP